MRLSDFEYNLPPELIAQHPLPNRASSRLLEVTGNDAQDLIINDRQFAEIIELIRPGDLLILNDTKVIPARLFGKKESGGAVEIMLERVTGEQTALAQIRASKSPKPGAWITIENEGKQTKICIEDRLDKESSPFFKIRFQTSCIDVLEEFGHIPLPPYIHHSATAEDNSRYQTVVAKNPGAVAAPTAGLHFDEAILSQLLAKGATYETLTLHVGAGTFSPVRVENIAEHTMHSEWFSIPPKTFQAVMSAKQEGRRVIAVGTTSLRALESAAKLGKPEGDTNLFITPGYQFQIVDNLITNFHLPGSTLLMLVSAFSGIESIRKAYHHAIEKKYRFFSYGDAMFLTRI